MSAIKLREGIWSVGILNPALRVFDIVMESKYGTSYNAYLLTGEKNVLIETTPSPTTPAAWPGCWNAAPI